MDGVSWRILLEDFGIGYQQLMKNEPIKFQDKTDSFQYWAAKLKDYSTSAEVLKELEYWYAVKDAKTEDLPVDYSAPEDKNQQIQHKQWQNRETVAMMLAKTETERLLRNVNWLYNTEINDILLAALGLAIKDWAGIKRVLINLEGHGREEIMGDVSISRTVGWYTTLFPVAFDLTRATELPYFIKSVKETLRQVPNRGMGYGILRYLTGEKAEDIAVEPAINFNYLGEFGQENHHYPDIFSFSNLRTGENVNPRLNALYQLDINGMVVSGQLRLSFNYNTYEYERRTIEKLLEAYQSSLAAIINHCTGKKEKELTPSDLDYKNFTIDQLTELEREFRQKNRMIEKIYRLSPMQAGMFYICRVNQDPSLYFEQFEFSLQGEVDRDLLEKSFNLLLARYDVLRTVFVQEGFQEPLQIVLKPRPSSVRFMDISPLELEACAHYIEKFKQTDREEGFDLSADILIRIALLKTGIDSYKVILSFHHTIMDGWCMGIIFKDLIHIYMSLRERQTISLEPVKPYSEFIKWLETWNKEKAWEFWKEYLDGYDRTVGLPKYSKPGKEIEYKLEEYSLVIDEELTTFLVMAAHENQVTINTMLQTLWGILLQKMNQTDDVVFGAVVSGRPHQVEDVEKVVGLFINTIPVRIRLGQGKTTFRQLTKDVQQKSLLSKPHEYLPLADIELCSPLKNKLLDHIMIFENYPVQKEIKRLSKSNSLGFEVTNINVFEKTNYDCNLVVAPGKTILVKFSYNRNLYHTTFIKKVGMYFLGIISQVKNHGNTEVSEIGLIPYPYEKSKPGDLQVKESNILNEVQGDFGF